MTVPTNNNNNSCNVVLMVGEAVGVLQSFQACFIMMMKYTSLSMEALTPQ